MTGQERLLADFIREACRRKGVSLAQASLDMGRSRNWLERIVNYEAQSGKGIRRPRVEACDVMAHYFGVDANMIKGLAGYISPPPVTSTPVEELVIISRLLPVEDQLTLLEHAKVLNFRWQSQNRQIAIQLPHVPGIDWDILNPAFAQELAQFIQQEPASVPIWVEALQLLPPKAVECLLLNARNQAGLKDCHRRETAARILAKLAAL